MLRLLASDADRSLALKVLASLNQEAESVALLVAEAQDSGGAARTIVDVGVDDTIVALWTPQSCGNHLMHEIAGAAFGRSALINIKCGNVDLPVVISMVQHIELDERYPQLDGLSESVRRSQIFLRNPLTTVGDDAPYVFISYARRDVAQIEPILSFLADIGIPYWLDRNIVAGTWSDEINRHLNRCAVVLVVWTENACKSSWVAAEAAYAYQANKLVGFRLSACQPQPHLRLAASNAVRQIEELVPGLAALMKAPKLQLLADALRFIGSANSHYLSEKMRQDRISSGISIQKRISRLAPSGEFFEQVQARLDAAVEVVERAEVASTLGGLSLPVHHTLEPYWRTEKWASLGVLAALATAVAIVVAASL